MTRGAGRIAAALAIAAVAAAGAIAAVGRADTAASRPTLAWPTKCITDGPETPKGGSIFPELKALHARVWVGALSWARIASSRPVDPRAPDDPAYAWPKVVDVAVRRARASGIEPVLYVNGFPAWSNGGRDQTWVPTNPADYGDFMAAAVRRYPQVRRWIAFAEPTHYVNFRPQGGRGRRAPRLYARL